MRELSLLPTDLAPHALGNSMLTHSLLDRRCLAVHELSARLLSAYSYTSFWSLVASASHARVTIGGKVLAVVHLCQLYHRLTGAGART